MAEEIDPNIELRSVLLTAATDKTLEAVVTERGVNITEIVAADEGELVGLGLLFLSIALLQDDRAGFEYLLGDGEEKPGAIVDVTARVMLPPVGDGEAETAGKWRYAAALILAYYRGQHDLAEQLVRRGIPLQVQWGKTCEVPKGLPETVHHSLLTGDTVLTAACRTLDLSTVQHVLSSSNKLVLAQIWPQFTEAAEPLLLMSDGTPGKLPEEEGVLALLFGCRATISDEEIGHLARIYTALQVADKKFEIIFVSSDSELESYEQVRLELPGLAIGFEHSEKRQEIRKLFGVAEDAKTVRLFEHSGAVLNVDAMPVLSADADASQYPWQQQEAGLHVWPAPANVKSTTDLVNTSSRGNERAVHVALQSSDYDTATQIVTELLNAGADVQLIDDTGATATGTAALYGHLESMKTLLQQSAAPDLEAVLRAACTGHRLDCAEHLVSLGASVHAPDKAQQRNCLMLACIADDDSICNVKLVEFLLTQHSDVHCCDKRGLSALHFACKDHSTKSEFQVVQMLIDAGADTYLADSRGQTAWDYAQADSGVYAVLAQPVSIDMCFVLGPPGSGKSSQAKLLANAFNFKVYTVESCLSEASKLRPGINVALQQLQAQKKGQIPAALVATALRSCLEILQRNTPIDEGEENHKVCLDGFPSTIQEAMELEQVIGLPHYVFALDVPYQDAMRRICLDDRGKRISEEAVQRLSTAVKDFQLGFDAIAEHYETAGTLRRFSSSDKEGVMGVFNNVKPQYGYLEASAIINRMKQQAEGVTQSRLAGEERVNRAKQNIQDLRTATATEIRHASHENTLILTRTRAEKYGTGC